MLSWSEIKKSNLIWRIDLTDEFFRTILLAHTYSSAISELSTLGLEVVVDKDSIINFMMKCFNGVNRLLNN